MVGFVRIMELWGVGNAEMRRILGSPPERTFYEWKAGRTRRLPEDTIRRIGCVAGIYKALLFLYSDPADADAAGTVAAAAARALAVPGTREAERRGSFADAAVERRVDVRRVEAARQIGGAGDRLEPSADRLRSENAAAARCFDRCRAR